ncbi:MAG TPA: outer membrane beta-barrel protein [Puia sp.]|nr:outer membrane beta-barrel protein [Puia sp.]
MKKTIALSLMALTVFFAKGQTSKNSWLVGGTIGFSSSSEKDGDLSATTKSTSFQLSPGGGYFFLDNLAAGIDLNLNLIDEPAPPSGGFSTTATEFTAGPLVRYYFNVAPNVKLFLHGEATWGSYKVKYTEAGATVESPPSMPISTYLGKAGIAFFLNQKVALEFTAGYESLIEKEESLGENTKYTTGIIQIGLGLQVYLGPSKKKK